MYNSPNRVLQKRIQHMFHTLSLSVVAINVVGTPVHNVPPKHQSTIVTAYFKIPSKHSFKEYDKWSANMLSLQDPMVIYTTADLVPTIRARRQFSRDRTVIIPMTLNQTIMAKTYDYSFWENQHKIDPERRRHRDPRLYWIWNEKPRFIARVVRNNPFNSTFFAWVDIGYFRTTMFNNQMMIRQIPPSLKPDQVLMLNVSLLDHFNYVGGGFIGGYAEGIKRWNTKYYAIIHNNAHKFIGKEQPWMSKTCKETSGLCALVVPDRNHGDPWFFMAPFMAGLANNSSTHAVVG